MRVAVGSFADTRLQHVTGIAVVNGHVVVADTYNNKIRKVRIDNQLVTSYRVERRLDEPGGLAFGGNTLYIANTNAHEIVRVNLRSGTTEPLNVSDRYIGL